MMKAPYSEAFQEQALEKVYERGNRSIRAVASDLNVSYYTLKGWMKKMGTPPAVRAPAARATTGGLDARGPLDGPTGKPWLGG